MLWVASRLWGFQGSLAVQAAADYEGCGLGFRMYGLGIEGLGGWLGTGIQRVGFGD